MKGAEDVDGFNRRERQGGRDIRCNPGQPQDLYAESLAGFLHRLEIGAGELLKSQHQRLAAYGLSDRFSMRREMISNRGANEIRAVGIETFLDEKIDLAEIYEAKIDRNFLGVQRSCRGRCHLSRSLGIHMEVYYHPYGWLHPAQPLSVARPAQTSCRSNCC